MEGWIKIHRKITEWEWYTETNTFVLFIHLLLTCNFKKTKWRGIELAEGESIKGLETLSEETGLSVQNIRTAIKNLLLTGELTERQHGKHRILTVKNYKTYQLANRESNNLPTGSQQDANKEVTADKEGKKVKKEKNIKYFENGKLNSAFIDFVENRKQAKKSMTPIAISRAVAKLSKYPVAEATRALTESIIGNWSGLFPDDSKRVYTREELAKMDESTAEKWYPTAPKSQQQLFRLANIAISNKLNFTP